MIQPGQRVLWIGSDGSYAYYYERTEKDAGERNDTIYVHIPYHDIIPVVSFTTVQQIIERQNETHRNKD